MMQKQRRQEGVMARPVRVVGLGGSLRAESTSRTTLGVALDGAGSVSGSFKNALDWLILLAERDPPYLSNKPIGLITTAGGVQGLQAVNTMDFIARSLRGWSVPLVLPVSQSWQSFDPEGHLKDEAVAAQLHQLGAEVVRAARQFQADGTCDYAQDAPVKPAAG
jgi:FMN reductase